MDFKMSDKAQTIKIYNLRSDTHEFIGAGDAYIPPHTGLPANCTTKPAPETEDGFVAIFDLENGKWTVCEDHRGEVVYDIKTGNEIFITSLGAYPAETTTTPPANSWQKWDGEAWIDDAVAKHSATVSEAAYIKKNKQNKANSIIDTLQDAIDYKMATDNEKELLVEWKKYRVLLNRINPEDVLNIDWPVEPASQ